MSDSPTELADVVEIGELQALVERKERDYLNPACQHKGGTWIDAERRELSCKACKAVLDPIEWIAGLAADRVRFQREMEWRRKASEATSVHAPGIGGDLLRCKAQPGGRWTVTITNRPETVTCTRCRQR